METVDGRFKNKEDELRARKARDQVWSRAGFQFKKLDSSNSKQRKKTPVTIDTTNDAIIEFESTKSTIRLRKALDPAKKTQTLIQLLKLYISPSELSTQEEALLLVQCSIEIYGSAYDPVVLTSKLDGIRYDLLAAYAQRAQYWKRMKPKLQLAPQGVVIQVRLIRDSLTEPPFPAVQVPETLYNRVWAARGGVLVLRAALQEDMEYALTTELQENIVVHSDSFKVVDTVSLVRSILVNLPDRARFFAENGLVFSGPISDALHEYETRLEELIEQYTLGNTQSVPYINAMAVLHDQLRQARNILQSDAYKLVALKDVVGPSADRHKRREWIEQRRAFWTDKEQHVSYPFRQWVQNHVYPLVNGILYRDWDSTEKQTLKMRAGLPWIHYLRLAHAMQETLLSPAVAASSANSAPIAVSRAFWPAAHSRDKKQRGPDFDALKPGDRYRNHGFLATSYSAPPENFHHNECCVMRIDVPPGYPCLLMQSAVGTHYFDAEYEKELLFPAGTVMEFVKFEMMRLRDGVMRVAHFKLVDDDSDEKPIRNLFEKYFKRLYPDGFYGKSLMRSLEMRDKLNQHLFGRIYQPYTAAGMVMLLYEFRGKKDVYVALGLEAGGSYAGQYNLFGGRHDKPRTRAETARAEYNEEFASANVSILRPELTDDVIRKSPKLFANLLKEPGIVGDDDDEFETTTIVLAVNARPLPNVYRWNAENARLRANPAVPQSYKEMLEISYFSIDTLRSIGRQISQDMLKYAETGVPVKRDGDEVRVSVFALQAVLDFDAIAQDD